MAAFERIQSGIPAMDAALDNIRLGDNVVWQVSSLDEFRVCLQDPLQNRRSGTGEISYIYDLRSTPQSFRRWKGCG